MGKKRVRGGGVLSLGRRYFSLGRRSLSLGRHSSQRIPVVAVRSHAFGKESGGRFSHVGWGWGGGGAFSPVGSGAFSEIKLENETVSTPQQFFRTVHVALGN